MGQGFAAGAAVRAAVGQRLSGDQGGVCDLGRPRGPCQRGRLLVVRRGALHDRRADAAGGGQAAVGGVPCDAEAAAARLCGDPDLRPVSFVLSGDIRGERELGRAAVLAGQLLVDDPGSAGRRDRVAESPAVAGDRGGRRGSGAGGGIAGIRRGRSLAGDAVAVRLDRAGDAGAGAVREAAGNDRRAGGDRLFAARRRAGAAACRGGFLSQGGAADAAVGDRPHVVARLCLRRGLQPVESSVDASPDASACRLPFPDPAGGDLGIDVVPGRASRLGIRGGRGLDPRLAGGLAALEPVILRLPGMLPEPAVA